MFEGMDGLFRGMLGSHGYLLQALLWSTRGTHLPRTSDTIQKEIVVHVRLGDFAPAPTAEISAGKANCRIPVGWYVLAVQRVRKAIGANITVNVFSDGSGDELAELLALPACKMVGFGSAIGDLIALSRGGVLIASGSTFSMWASYFGQMPTIWHSGQLKQRINRDPRFEIEVGAEDELPASFLEPMKIALLGTAGKVDNLASPLRAAVGSFRT